MGVKRRGVRGSGRGSNRMAIHGAGLPVGLSGSDNAAAAWLDGARTHGRATFALAPRGIGKPAFEAALDAALRDAGIEAIALDCPPSGLFAFGAAGEAVGPMTTSRDRLGRR